MDYKRITLLSGHYGSGKTNIAVNMAEELRTMRERVAVADLDIVNPYFRTRDSEDELKEAGIRMIVSEYANSNLDIPALPQEMYALVDDRGLSSVVDVGGDDRGALALGRIAPAIREEQDYDMFLVVNLYRPLTPDPDEDVLRTVPAAEEIARRTGLPLVLTCAEKCVARELEGKVCNLFPMHLQKRPV